MCFIELVCIERHTGSLHGTLRRNSRHGSSHGSRHSSKSYSRHSSSASLRNSPRPKFSSESEPSREIRPPSELPAGVLAREVMDRVTPFRDNTVKKVEGKNPLTLLDVGNNSMSCTDDVPPEGLRILLESKLGAGVGQIEGGEMGYVAHGGANSRMARGGVRSEAPANGGSEDGKSEMIAVSSEALFEAALVPENVTVELESGAVHSNLDQGTATVDSPSTPFHRKTNATPAITDAFASEGSAGTTFAEAWASIEEHGVDDTFEGATDARMHSAIGEEKQASTTDQAARRKRIAVDSSCKKNGEAALADEEITPVEEKMTPVEEKMTHVEKKRIPTEEKRTCVGEEIAPAEEMIPAEDSMLSAEESMVLTEETSAHTEGMAPTVHFPSKFHRRVTEVKRTDYCPNISRCF